MPNKGANQILQNFCLPHFWVFLFFPFIPKRDDLFNPAFGSDKALSKGNHYAFLWNTAMIEYPLLKDLFSPNAIFVTDFITLVQTLHISIAMRLIWHSSCHFDLSRTLSVHLQRCMEMITPPYISYRAACDRWCAWKAEFLQTKVYYLAGIQQRINKCDYIVLHFFSSLSQETPGETPGSFLRWTWLTGLQCQHLWSYVQISSQASIQPSFSKSKPYPQCGFIPSGCTSLA